MEKRDYIEELIRENRELLNSAEPPEGHFDRFMAKLEAEDEGAEDSSDPGAEGFNKPGLVNRTGQETDDTGKSGAEGAENKKVIIDSQVAGEQSADVARHSGQIQTEFSETGKQSAEISRFSGWKSALRIAWRVAAVLVFVFLAGNQARLWFFQPEKAPMSLGAISPEYAEVEFYYTSAIQSGLGNLGRLAESGVISKAENDLIQKEFKEFEQRYESILLDLEAHPNDERVINAMIEHYQSKLEIINMILNKLQDVKNENNKNHEKVI